MPLCFRSLEQQANLKNLRILTASVLLLPLPLFAREKIDVLVMNNGDRITCEIKGLDRGVLYVGIDYVEGTVQMDWKKVRRAESKQLFVVKTQNGRIYTGALSMEERDRDRIVRIEAAESRESTEPVKQSEVVGISQTSTDFWRRFNGAINSGFTYSKANESTQFSLGAETDYLRERWSAGENFVSTLTGNTGAATSTRNSVIGYYRHLMRWDNWFYTGIGALLQSTEQNIGLQGDAGVGIGRFVKNTNRCKISIVGGAAYQNTRYSKIDSKHSDVNIAAAFAGVNAGLFRFDKSNLSAQAIAIPALNEPGRIYNNVNMTYYLKVWSDITWNLSFYGNWDNQPPQRLSGSDYGMSVGIGWTFGNYNSFTR